jgi:hypothetical protein
VFVTLTMGVSLYYTYWTAERGGGGVNQLLPCLDNYAYFKLFAENLMTITIMQGGKQ